MTRLTVTAEAGETEVFGTKTSDIQTGVTVGTDSITGTLKYLTEGAIPDYWGAGNFVVLKFSNIDQNATSVKVGLIPSAGSGLVELIDDPDKNGVFKVSDKYNQKIAVITSDGTNEVSQYYTLNDLITEGE